MMVAAPEQPGNSDGDQYNFGAFSLRHDGTLLRGTAIVPIPPKELEILRVLIANAGQIVSADQLRRAAWGNTHVSADSLPRCISSLRARLDPEDCIATVYKQGYRFTLPVNRTQPEVSLPSADQPAERADTRVSIRPRALPRLVILPLTTGPGVPEHLGSGIADATMLRLGRTRIPVADVLARHSVLTLAAQGLTAEKIGATLNADFALTGTISALPVHFRLRVEMIRLTDTLQLWAEDFLLPRTLLSYADARLAKRIAARIQQTFTRPSTRNPALKTELTDSPTVVPSYEARRSRAYSIYLQARANWASFDRAPMQDAVHGFQHALELDPNLAAARAQLMHSYLALSSLGYMQPGTAAELARKQAETLVTAASSIQSVHPALGWIHFFHHRDIHAATAAYARAQRPAHSLWATIYQVRFALGRGRTAEALSLLHTALETDPYAPALHWRLTWALHLAGEAEAALDQANRTIELFPRNPGALLFCSTIFAANSGPIPHKTDSLAEQAVALATRLTELAPTLDIGHATLAYAQARMGRTSDARSLLARQERLPRERYVMRSFHAPLLVELGELDAAIDTLSIAEEQHCPWLFELLSDPRLEPLHGKPGFRRLGELAGQMSSQDASVA